MPSMRDLSSAAARLLGNMTLTAATLAATGTSAATIKSTGTITYIAGGKLKTKSALSGQAMTAAPTTSSTKADGTAFTQAEVDAWRQYVIPAGEVCYIVVALDGGGNVIILQGSYDDQDLQFRGQGLAKGKSEIPDIPDGVVPIGIMKMAYASAFTLGTTATDVAGISYQDVAFLPLAKTL